MFRQLLKLFRKERGDQGETTPRQKEDDLLSSKTGRKKSFWGRLGFGRKTSSQIVISEQEKCRKELEELKLEIQKCKFERDELYQILDFYIYDDWDLSITHSQLLREQAQLKNKIQILLNEKREQLVEQTELPASSVEAKRLCEEAGMNICDPRAKQQQGRLRLQEVSQTRIFPGEDACRNGKEKVVLVICGVCCSSSPLLPVYEEGVCMLHRSWV
eukprot:XP_017455757.1 PREDICTED: uncharacterized protein LOC689268 isoform X1 [Rattus norvegicus]